MVNLDPVSLIAISVGLGLVPFLLMMTTSYVKIVVVLMLVRNALGVQQIPPQISRALRQGLEEVRLSKSSSS